MPEIIIQEPGGDYEIHVPFKAKSSKKYRLVEVIEQEEEQSKDDRLHKIYEKVKEANTPDKHSFEFKDAEYRMSNYLQVRELTDEEWLKLPKEEILQLYKNCYQMLMNYCKVDPPQESKQPKRMAEEILRKHIGDDFIFPSYYSDEKILQFKDKIVQAMEEYSEQSCDHIQELFSRPAEKLKPLQELYRKEHPKDGFYIPDATEFYTWIAEKVLSMGDEIKCDVCGCHPSMIVQTQYGRFCIEHAKYI